MFKICIFAGTSEGRQLVERLSARGLGITVCVATEYGKMLLGEHPEFEVRTGRMDAEQMAAFFLNEEFSLVVDATHPYANLATENIIAACGKTGTEYMRLLRSSASEKKDGIFVPNTQVCAEFLKETSGNILITTGSKELPVFCEDESLKSRLYVRILPMQASLQICVDCGIAPERIIAMQGPFNEEMNLAMLRWTQAKYIVTKDTGNTGGYEAKISAAEKSGAQAIIIGRPDFREGLSLEEALDSIERRFALPPARKKVFLVGVGMGNLETRTFGMERALCEAECIIGAERMLEMVKTTGKRTYFAVAAEEIARIIRQSNARSFAVLLSGDIGFYSGAKRLIGVLEDMEIHMLPGVSSLQYFCAVLRYPWENVRAISLHGRNCNFEHEIRTNPAVFSLVGGAKGVNDVFERMCQAGLGDLQVFVGERLGYPEEKISSGTANTLKNGKFDALSVVLIKNDAAGNSIVTHGLPDEAFERDAAPMTKSEVRSISLSKLQLTQNAIIYDIGSGSGSVSVECAIQASAGRVYAIEMKEEALNVTRKNVERFHLSNLELINGRAPEALEDLPSPTHVFIGGSSGNLHEIIDCLMRKNPNVRIVANAVTLETLAELTEIAKEFKFSDVAEISVAKPRILGKYHLMTAQNPVYIVSLQNYDG